jgi:Winged helix DNA-binding domain
VTAAREAAFRVSRNHLNARAPRGALVEVTRRIGGLHAQVMSSADLSLWTRIRGHRPDDLPRALWEDRTLVKTWLMRGTLHLVPAKDLPMYCAALDSRGHYAGAWLRYFDVTARDMERLIDVIADSLDDEPRTRRELGAAVKARLGKRMAKNLEGGWGSFLKPAARRGILCFGPSQGQNVTFVRPDVWLSDWREFDQDTARQELVRRFLTAYGPASRDEFAEWSGGGHVRGMHRVWGEIVHELAEVEPKRFVLARDVEALERAKPSRVVRLLPGFDPFLLPKQVRPYLVRTREDYDRIYRPQGWITPVVLQGGRALALWPWKRRGKKLQIDVEPLDGAPAPPAVNHEATALARYLGAEVELRTRSRP